ncbi:hypothetical protein K461DRAFT_273972 [Myriangium duriaei CBS 260.36]|uniref:Uncharacterized protein n=1 Tax=Myriangium duriaei CBS 260.36 TaxID=1168546 RepID=A0A9P4J9E1_9PEZI|nr:hypothetical protein K461DRAFT_273972 [Myriangium duriaei CBS 260.36]
MGKRTKIGRMLIVCFVFLLSGFNHLVQEWTIYGEMNWCNFWWWTAQPVFLWVEESGQTIAMTWLPCLQGERRYIFMRIWLGRLWVFTIFFWGILKFQFMD